MRAKRDAGGRILMNPIKECAVILAVYDIPNLQNYEGIRRRSTAIVSTTGTLTRSTIINIISAIHIR